MTNLCCVGSQSYKDYDCCFGWTRWFAELQNDSITDIVTFKISLFHYQIPPDMTSSWGNWFLNAERESDRNYSSLRRVSIRYLPINILTTYLPYGTEGRGGWMSITFFFIHCTVYSYLVNIILFSSLKTSLICNLSLPTTENSDIIYMVILFVITPLLYIWPRFSTSRQWRLNSNDL